MKGNLIRQARFTETEMAIRKLIVVIEHKEVEDLKGARLDLAKLSLEVILNYERELGDVVKEVNPENAYFLMSITP